MARGGIKLTSALVFDSVRAPVLRTFLQKRNNAVGIVTGHHKGPKCALGISFDDGGLGAKVGNETIAENLEDSPPLVRALKLCYRSLRSRVVDTGYDKFRGTLIRKRRTVRQPGRELWRTPGLSQ